MSNQVSQKNVAAFRAVIKKLWLSCQHRASKLKFVLRPSGTREEKSIDENLVHICEELEQVK